MSDYTQEQFWKLYKKLPEELQEALFSIESADFVYELCVKNNIEKFSEINKYIGDVLIGILPVAKFQETLEKELDIETEIAKNVTQEINRLIFLPVRPSIERLHEIKTVTPKTQTEQNKEFKKPIQEEKIETKEKIELDRYRESIE